MVSVLSKLIVTFFVGFILHATLFYSVLVLADVAYSHTHVVFFISLYYFIHPIPELASVSDLQVFALPVENEQQLQVR